MIVLRIREVPTKHQEPLGAIRGIAVQAPCIPAQKCKIIMVRYMKEGF